MKKTIILAVAVICTIMLTGCGHNIHTRGVYLACPYGAIGYGEFSCVKSNVSVESTEETGKDGVKTTNKFTVGKQITGYDVDLKKAENKEK